MWKWIIFIIIIAILIILWWWPKNIKGEPSQFIINEHSGDDVVGALYVNEKFDSLPSNFIDYGYAVGAGGITYVFNKTLGKTVILYSKPGLTRTLNMRGLDFRSIIL